MMDKNSKERLRALKNPHVERIIDQYIKICRPNKVTVLDDSQESRDYARSLALKNSEEFTLHTEGHTYHFDSPLDQGRDLLNTRVMVNKDHKLSKAIETIDREAALKEILQLLDGIMGGREMLVQFYCLGPNDSGFSIPALQLTDSAYVVHSEDILYRPGYKDFAKLKGSKKFFHFIHSAGRLKDGKCVDIDKRRVYMDLEEERVFTVNNQYAGNSVGLKKLALRLAISKANKEDWLCEHMFIMGVKGHTDQSRVTYFTGAFPSACGKTSTAMVPGQTIIGDDIAYIKIDKEGMPRAVNVEQGIFGIIEDVNPIDDPLIYKALTTPRELIFSNILVKDEKPYWLGMGQPLPEEGTNYSGAWHKGKKDASGKDINAAHKNARYTIKMSELDNADPHIDDPAGVAVRGFIYGGRDSEASVPVLQSLGWSHGVYLGASLESEATAAVIGQSSSRKHNPMSNIEFLTIPVGTYIENHLQFGDDCDEPPVIFATNYFLKENGRFLNEKVDKKVWLLWMDGRVNEEYGAIETPVGYVPRYEDLKELFRSIFNKEYTHEEYVKQFSIRAKLLLERLDRIDASIKQENDIPPVYFQHLEQEKKRLLAAKKEYGDTIAPERFI
jgi:phosphoenolpyruvate carboxykinase (GTP)